MRKTNYNELLRRQVDKYRTSGNSWPATTRDIASWLVRTGQWEPSPEAAIEQCANDVARAMREEFVTDKQGRRVRAKHAARIEVNGEQQTFWADIRTATRQHMEIAFAQRRQGILSDCAQLKRDVDSYNRNHCNGKAIQMVFDFTLDLEEMDFLEDAA